MNSVYVYQQFGVWWIFFERTAPDPIRLVGPYRTRELAEEALLTMSVELAV